MRSMQLVELDPSELVVGLVRKSQWSRMGRFAFAVFWVLIPFFFFFPLIHFGAFGLFIFAVLLITGVWNALRQWVSWRYTMFIISDMRVIDIDQTGVFKRSVEELKMDEIDNVRAETSGLYQKIFKLGTVRVETDDPEGFDLELTGVKDPENVRDLILDVQYIHHKETDEVHAA